ncbi:MAG: type II toxin-antitoxin system HicA family toxin [Phreatobacter sp.]|uniref:type II toxin-antitoxin system HicA family toxin n=1 Tax=Phreatobacter sp. TaxID=1966341 RepID=UPI0027333B45|nr:type II toxin-antitoxin system HicA family toxin [Phreatobacter sp.]MDP2802720.1 type II toxin-antitoxin system HicA family toxin [Phreatobacter sp.]
MGRAAKLMAAARSGSSLSFRDFEALLAACGFRLRATSGSHRLWKHEGSGVKLSVQSDGKDVKRYQIRQFLAIVDTHDLTLDER